MLFRSSASLLAQDPNPDSSALEQEQLRGTITADREWWDLRHYDLSVAVDIERRTIEGMNTIRFKALKPGRRMQIDLQPPLEITGVSWGEAKPACSRNGNAYTIEFPSELAEGSTQEISISYRGEPLESVNPPWSGGFSWRKDSAGKPFVATSCQGLGASVWWPCKDHGYDEPEEGADIRLTVPAGLVAVSNGRLIERTDDLARKTSSFHWRVTQPINNYSINANIGDYVNFGERMESEAGPLDMEYWVLRDQLDVAKEQIGRAHV